jgi:hypothetical protein
MGGSRNNHRRKRIMKKGFLQLLVAGMVMGFPQVLIRAEKIYLPLDAFAQAQQRAATLDCARQMVSILRTAQVWAMDNADQPPPGLQVLTNDLPTPAFFYCPAVFHATVPTNWSEMDWSNIDYTWLTVDWNNPTNVAYVCRAHNLIGRVDGTVQGENYRAGWPLLSASPVSVLATPGDEVRLELRLAPDAVLPASYQWRISSLEYVTNLVRVENPDDPRHPYWRTQVVPRFVGTNLPFATNTFLVLTNVQTTDPEWYNVVVSNQMGSAVSHQARVTVRSEYAGMTTNATGADLVCANNLKNIYLCARLMDEAGTGILPNDLKGMTNAWGEPIFGWPLTLYCRADTNHVAPSTWAEVDLDKTSYEIMPGSRLFGFEIFCQCRAHGYYVSVDGMTMLKPVFTGITNRLDGTVEVSFRTYAGKQNLIEYTEDWVKWQVLGTYGTEPAEVRTTDTAAAAQRFYRLRVK